MENVNLYQVFNHLMQQQHELNRILRCHDRSYAQILTNFDDLNIQQKLAVEPYLKSADELLGGAEYKKLRTCPQLRCVWKVFDNLMFNARYNMPNDFADDSFYLLPSDYAQYNSGAKDVSLKFVLLFYQETFNVYELVLSGVFLKKYKQSFSQSRDDGVPIETEFIAGCVNNSYFIVKIVRDISDDEDLCQTLKHRYNYSLYFADLQSSHIKQIKHEMFSLRKRLMLCLECEKNMLFSEDLGKVSLFDMLERFSDLSMGWWRNMLHFALVNPHVFSRKNWRRLIVADMFEGVFNGVKMMLQKFNGSSNVYEDESYFYFLDNMKETVVKFFWREGWMAEVFVQNHMPLEFPVITGDLVYFVKCVPDLQKEPLLGNMYENGEIPYIWNWID